ncbi:MAG: DUF3822 family protein [Flavobacteriales bacterium]
MQQLVLSFTDKSLTLLQKNEQALQVDQLPLELNKPLIKERISATIQAALQQSSLYRSTWFAPDYTLFPLNLFDPSQLQAYYELNHGKLPESFSLRYDTIESLELVVIYSVPKWLQEYCYNDLQNKQFLHEVSLQLRYLATKKQVDQIHVFFHEQQFVLTVFKQRQLLSCTATPFQQESDFIYFLLAHQQKLKLDQTFNLSLTQASLDKSTQNLTTLLSKFKDFEYFNIQELPLNNYQNDILCGSYEEH